MSKVSLVRCEAYDYEYTKVRAALERSVENLGGLASYLKKGEKVLLKVNLVMRKDPEAAATSDPVFVQALADLLIEWGVSVIIGDSPGGLFNERALRNVYEGCKMTEAAEKSGAVLNFNTGSQKVDNPQGLLLKTVTNANMLRDADKVISVARIKTHGMMRMTGAMKNMFGTVPGTLKGEYHATYTEPDPFADALIDICLCAAPVLSFVDGIIAMEGDGPTAGVPKKMGVVLASDNPFESDYVQSLLMGAEPESMPTVRQSIKRKLIEGDLSTIELTGDPIVGLIKNDFKTPKVKQINLIEAKIPKPLLWIARPFIQPRPVFRHEKCVGCGDCAANCPPKAIAMENRKPQVEMKKCIRCFCCQELCPFKAVEIKRPFIFRLISK